LERSLVVLTKYSLLINLSNSTLKIFKKTDYIPQL
jgi:hypothetical protein